jgi:HTH-type transcriptional regulator, sugar sensing transcriptional regulator
MYQWPHSLISLGLNAYEASAYVALLSRPQLSPPEVSRLSRIPRQRVYDVLDSLVSKGLCVARDGDATPKSYSAIDPKIALDLLADERSSALEIQKQQTQEVAVRAAAELMPLFASGRGQTDPLAYVEVLEGATRIARRALALAQAAKKRVNSCIKRPMILSKEQNETFLKAPLGRGLKYRALCDSLAVEDAELRSWIREYCEWGLEIRVASELPLKMQSFDDEAVLISMQDPAAGQPSFTAVAIHNRGLVAMLNLAFEHLWDGAQGFNAKAQRKERH